MLAGGTQKGFDLLQLTFLQHRFPIIFPILRTQSNIDLFDPWRYCKSSSGNLDWIHRFYRALLWINENGSKIEEKRGKSTVLLDHWHLLGWHSRMLRLVASSRGAVRHIRCPKVGFALDGKRWINTDDTIIKPHTRRGRPPSAAPVNSTPAVSLTHTSPNGRKTISANVGLVSY